MTPMAANTVLSWCILCSAIAAVMVLPKEPHAWAQEPSSSTQSENSSSADAGPNNQPPEVQPPEVNAALHPSVAPPPSPTSPNTQAPEADPAATSSAPATLHPDAPVAPPQPFGIPTIVVSVAMPPCPAPSAAPALPAYAPLWNPFPARTDDGDDSLQHKVFPSLGFAGRISLGGYFLLLAVVGGLVLLAGVARKRLPDRGVIPRFLVRLQIGLRAIVALLLLLLLASQIPASYSTVLFWIALSVALAAGWSAKDFLPDLWASVVLFVERRVRAGAYVTGPGYCGTVLSMGLRSTKLRSRDDSIVSVPNHALLGVPLCVEMTRHPAIEVQVRMPAGTEPAEAAHAIRDIALLCPWRVLLDMPEVFRDAEDLCVWRVRVRLIETRFRERFESALAEQVEEYLRGR